MAFDTNNFLIIGGVGPAYPNDVYIHERANDDGKPGKILTMGDAKGSPEEIAQQYIQDGFDPNKIIINGKLASDVFKKQTKEEAVMDAAVKTAPMPTPVVAMNPAQALLYSAVAKTAQSKDENVSQGSNSNTGVTPMVVMNPAQALLYQQCIKHKNKEA